MPFFFNENFDFVLGIRRLNAIERQLAHTEVSGGPAIRVKRKYRQIILDTPDVRTYSSWFDQRQRGAADFLSGNTDDDNAIRSDDNGLTFVEWQVGNEKSAAIRNEQTNSIGHEKSTPDAPTKALLTLAMGSGEHDTES